MNRKLVLLSAFVLFLSFFVIRVCGHDPSYEIVAVHGSTPTIDGAINIHEWGDAASITFNETEVLIKQDGFNLYIGFNMSYAPSLTYDQVIVFIDLEDNGGLTLQPDDIGLVVWANGTLGEANVTGGVWTMTEVTGWDAEMQSNSGLWQVEFNVTYSKIDVTAGVDKTIGAFFMSTYAATIHYYWPTSIDYGDYGCPSNWGAITSIGYSGYEVIAVYGPTPTIDGAIGSQEWSDAAQVSFNNTQVFVKQDGINLYIGFNNSETQFNDHDAVNIYFDVDHDGSLTLQSDDVGLGVYRNGTLIEANVTGGTWTISEVSGWTAVVNSTFDMWQVEFNITYSKISVVAGVEKTIGVVFVCWRGLEGSSPHVFAWPPGYLDIYTNPSMWGDITSTGCNWIPEFTSTIILPLFAMTAIVMVMLKKRMRRSKLGV